jgi:hypothetical protein
MLRNMAGSMSDGLSREYEGHARQTELGVQLPYINEIIDTTFQVDLIKSVRIFSASNGGFIRPHRDYLEFKEGFTRLHIPLKTDEKCFNSEEATVYHMRQGEIWMLDGRHAHSGGCFSEHKRLHLVLDFDPKVPLEDLFVNQVCYDPDAVTETIQRPPLKSKEMVAILALGEILSEVNFMDVAGLLGKIHFERDVSCAEMYDWLYVIAERSQNPALVQRAKEMKKYFLGED